MDIEEQYDKIYRFSGLGYCMSGYHSIYVLTIYIRELGAICFEFYKWASILAGAIAMFLSCVLKNMVAFARTICSVVFVDLFFIILDKIRVLSPVQYLTSIQILINGSATNLKLVRIGEHLKAYQLAAIIYIVLICVFCNCIARLFF